MEAAPRKGAHRIADVPPEILRELNAGRTEAANLVENLATDMGILLTEVFPGLSGGHSGLDPKAGITKRMSAIAAMIYERYGDSKLGFLVSHPSDLVRGWGAYLIAELPEQTLDERIAMIRQLADDRHFGVREWAWLALRPHIAKAPLAAIEILTPWTNETSECLRRFAVEATRPRGVWSAHISELKTNPAIGVPVLAPLCADPSRYVQDSVANWLNDAWKSKPAWVAQICAGWLDANDSEATRYIVKRALRNHVQR